jgi:hypothetical protein
MEITEWLDPPETPTSKTRDIDRTEGIDTCFLPLAHAPLCEAHTVQGLRLGREDELSVSLSPSPALGVVFRQYLAPQ